MRVRALTSNSRSEIKQQQVQDVVRETHLGSKKCIEIAECIEERLTSSRSTPNSLKRVRTLTQDVKLTCMQTLDLLKVLLVEGSEDFVTLAVESRDAVRALTVHSNPEGENARHDEG